MSVENIYFTEIICTYNELRGKNLKYQEYFSKLYFNNYNNYYNILKIFYYYNYCKI